MDSLESTMYQKIVEPAKINNAATIAEYSFFTCNLASMPAKNTERKPAIDMISNALKDSI